MRAIVGGAIGGLAAVAAFYALVIAALRAGEPEVSDRA